jgi:SAM-dependent methyltransferase
MIRDNSDISWERIGRNNPYFGVITEPQFRGTKLSEELQGQFFRSGSDHFSWLKDCMTRYFGALPRLDAACDFGCGVGRLLIPLAKEFKHVTGVDVSPAMLAEARCNCERLGLNNITLSRSDDDLAQFRNSFDFIHSYITLQHLPPRRGEIIIRRLLSCLSPEGIIAIHFYFHENTNPVRAMFREMRKRFPPSHWIANLIKGNPWNEPMMQHNIYNMGRILWLLQNSGIEEAHVVMTDAASAFVFAKNKGHKATPADQRFPTPGRLPISGITSSAMREAISWLQASVICKSSKKHGLPAPFNAPLKSFSGRS